MPRIRGSSHRPNGESYTRASVYISGDGMIIVFNDIRAEKIIFDGSLRKKMISRASYIKSMFFPVISFCAHLYTREGPSEVYRNHRFTKATLKNFGQTIGWRTKVDYTFARHAVVGPANRISRVPLRALIREKERGCWASPACHEVNTCRTGGEREHIACCLAVRCAFLQFFSALAGPITPAPAICVCESTPLPWIEPDVSLGSSPKYL